MPKKNILDLNGKPLIAYSIEAAISSKYIDKVCVSSDYDDVLDIAKRYAVESVKRPEALSSDEASSYDAVVHTIESMQKYDYTVLLQPTSPLRDARNIDEAIELLYREKADALISVCKCEHSPLWSNTLPENGNMTGFLKEDIKNKRSQDLDVYYRINGAIYICRTDRLLKEKTFFLEDHCVAYKMDRKVSVDIDDEVDFKLAEVLLTSVSENR